MPRWLACALLLNTACGRTSEPQALERTAPLISTPQNSSPSTASAAAAAAAPDLPAKKAGHGVPSSKIKHVIVIAMENHDADQIYGDPLNAPYIHSLLEQY